MIPSNQYSQLHDYLTQVISWSKKEGLGRITQKLIGERLLRASSEVSRFLSWQLKKPRTMLTNFKENFPAEFKKWPLNQETLGRTLQKVDICYFLGRKTFANSSQLPVPFPPLVIPQTTDSPNNLRPQKPGTRPARKIVPYAFASQKGLGRVVPIAPIAISYRGHQSDKDGAGMLFDHMCIQNITRISTYAYIPNGVAKSVENIFLREIKAHPASLLFGNQTDEQLKAPPFTSRCENLGLLIIPGRVRKIEDEPTRLKHEYKSIRAALNRGQPMIGLCAGSWRLYEQIFTWTRFPDYLNTESVTLSDWHKGNKVLIEVEDHNYGAGMLRLAKNGIHAVNNVQIHDILIAPTSLLHVACGGKEASLTVNSVHWKAVNPKRLPSNVIIGALSAENPSIKINTRQSTLMRPQENIVEAFESEFGAPVMGVQWHPEGYRSKSPHGKLLKYMALAGHAYAIKRKMLQELNERFKLINLS